jgi:hypothetical protein
MHPGSFTNAHITYLCLRKCECSLESRLRKRSTSSSAAMVTAESENGCDRAGWCTSERDGPRTDQDTVRILSNDKGIDQPWQWRNDDRFSLSMALSASIPLVDIFPWSIHEASTIVIVNSSAAAASLDGNPVDVDGRFLLYQIVSHVISSPSGTDGTSGHRKLPGKVQSDSRLGKRHRVLWLSSKPVTPRHIVNGLKKIGLTKADELTSDAPPRTKAAANTNDATVTSPSPESGHPNLVVRSVMEELGAAVLKQGRHVPSGDDLSSRFSAMDRVEFVKRELYDSIRDWVSKGEESNGEESKGGGEGNTSATSSSTSWIVMDDVDTLAALLGDRLVSGLIQSVQALAVDRNVGLVIQCCSSDDENSEDHGSSGRWVGASGTVRGSGFDGDEVQLSPLLAELADYMVDACSLKSGPTREAHGRLVLTTMRDMTSAHFNYCLADNRATAIRIRQHPPR